MKRSGARGRDARRGAWRRAGAALIALAAAGLGGACRGDEPPASQPEKPPARASARPATTTPRATSPSRANADAPTVADVAPRAAPAPDTTPAAAPEDVVASPEEETPTDANVGPATLRDRVRACYVATYCAQRRGEPRRVLALYAEFGFEGPSAWREAWDGEAKDPRWLEEVTQDALRACP
ncbi:MAG: hypothetical protein H6745_24205 [Deltaproteobacteria bacterium]|nr:hypothetical protein [Deltaproteobacteria bacterium]